MALDESGKYFLDKVLTGADGVLAIGAAVAPGNISNLYITSHSIAMNSVKNYGGGSNQYQAIGKAVGDVIQLVGFGLVGKYAFKKVNNRCQVTITTSSLLPFTTPQIACCVMLTAFSYHMLRVALFISFDYECIALSFVIYVFKYLFEFICIWFIVCVECLYR